jgi:hypothetical protein
LQQALASGNQEFRILFNGIPQLSGIFPKVSNVTFDEGTWTTRIDYSFTFDYEEDFFSTSVQSFTEAWTFDEQEDRRSVTANHNVSAVGLNTNPSGANNAFANARTFVLSKTGYDNVVAGSPAFVQVSGTPTAAYEELRNEQVDVQGGTFAVSETFTLSSGTFIHTRTGQFSQDDNGVGTVSINGNIRGLGRGDTAYPRALSAWDDDIKPKLPADASGIYSELGGDATLFTTSFNSLSVTRNTFGGTLDYSVAYTDSPTENLPSGILDFTFAIADQEPVRLKASFSIFDRSLGNVVQDVGTSTEGTFSIQGNTVGKPGFPFDDLLSFVEDKVNESRPIPANYVTLRLTQKQINKDELNNTIQFNIGWTYTKELSGVEDGTTDLVID